MKIMHTMLEIVSFIFLTVGIVILVSVFAYIYSHKTLFFVQRQVVPTSIDLSNLSGLGQEQLRQACSNLKNVDVLIESKASESATPSATSKIKKTPKPTQE